MPKLGRGSFSANFGLHGRAKSPACKGRILVERRPVREALSLFGLGLLWLKRSQAKQGQPMRMALAGHHFARAFALTFCTSAAHEALMVQVELQ